MAITPAQAKRRLGTTTSQTFNLGIPQVGVTPRPGTTTGSLTTLGSQINQGGALQPPAGATSTVITPATPTASLLRGGGAGTTQAGTKQTTKPVPTDQASCQAAGGQWEYDPSTGNGSCKIFQKDPAIANITPTSQTPASSVPSPTATVAASQAAGLPVAQSVATSMKGEVAGLAAKAQTQRDKEFRRKWNEKQTLNAQNWAKQGMSYSSAHLADATDQVRELAANRVLSEQEAQTMQNNLDAAAFAAAEPIEKLAMSAKLGGTASTPGFQPGNIPTTAYGGSIAAIGAAPTTSLPTKAGAKTSSGTGGDDPDSEYFDPEGFQCSFGEQDSMKRCPDNPYYEAGAEG